ncbi:MAG TPA: glycosyltransferase [Acidimicrobiales bacterium]|nr:glycosyltransferase [Acidimicrobiales bacterium]
MHVLFVHRSFPAQFGHIAAHLVRQRGYRCTFVSGAESGSVAGIESISYRPAGEASNSTHLFARAFEEKIRHARGVYDALQPLRHNLHPDLIVGHAALGGTVFLPDVFPATPILNYFEDFYQPDRSPSDFRPEWPRSKEDRLRARAQTAMSLLHLEYCDAAYSPTHFQHSLLPRTYHRKATVLHDGIDTEFWRRQGPAERDRFGSPRIVTYVARALEPMRGFDIFMRVAKRIYEQFPDVVFLVVGSEHGGYGDQIRHIPESSFKEHVLKSDEYDLERIQFLGPVTPEALVAIFSMSDLHIYLTVPFVLSWSLLGAMACGCTVVASDTAPVREVIRQGENGLLGDFFDVDGLAEAALEVLRDPPAFRALGEAAERTIAERYSLEVVLPQMTALYESVARARNGPP